MTLRAAAPVVRARSAPKSWVPDRQDVIWIDCNPQTDAEMRVLHPMLVLSPRTFNAKTGIVIGLPMTTAAYNLGNPFAIDARSIKGLKAGKTGYVLCHQPKSFDWRARPAKPHPMKRLDDALFGEACGVLNQISGLA